VISVRSLFFYCLYIVLFISVMAGAGFITARLIVKSGKEIQVPDVRGMEVVDALETLSRAELSLKVDGFEYSSSVTRNAVLRQEPDPGIRLKTGGSIRIVLSRGPERIPVPNLVGMTRRQAEIMLKRNGLLVGHISETHFAAPEQGRILAQQPEPLNSIQRGSAVNLLVSLGPRRPRYIMPDLTGRPLGQAVLTLERMNLKVGEIRTLHHLAARPGQVLEQTPEKGHAVSEGDAVALVVQSDGDEGRHVFRLALVRYTVPPGFLRSRVEIKLRRGDSVIPVYRQFIDSGESVAVMVLVDNKSRVILSVDGRDVRPQQFRLQEFKNAS